MNDLRSDPNLKVDDALAALNDLYAQVDSEIASLAPVCQLSARCCRFREYGHDLFVSRLELEAWLRSGETAVSADSWRPGENCPWQSASGLCEARLGRPLGCRVYFCDPNFAEAMPEITEKAIAQIKRITTQAGMQWDYRPAHRHLSETERMWRTPLSARMAGKDVASTSGDVLSSREHSEEDAS